MVKLGPSRSYSCETHADTPCGIVFMIQYLLSWMLECPVSAAPTITAHRVRS